MPFLDLLVKQLRNTFPDCVVYSESVKQKLITPCFVISFENISRQRQLLHQVTMNVRYVVTYIPTIEKSDQSDIGVREDMYKVSVEFETNPVWKYLGESFHIHNLETQTKKDFMQIHFNVVGHFKYVVPVEEPMEGVWVGSVVYDPINNPGIRPGDPDDPDNPTDPDDPDGNMGSIIIN